MQVIKVTLVLAVMHVKLMVASVEAPLEASCHSCCQGQAGTPGIPGLHGNHGGYGPLGPKGDVGSPGDFGVPGATGDNGSDGSMGQPGNPGDHGPKGEQGVGVPGKQGPQGPPGLGEQGAAGERGLTGRIGQPGRQGSSGFEGENCDCYTQRSAFTAVRRHTFEASLRRPFSFEELLFSEEGTVFNLSNGTFTCNVPGTYVFLFSFKIFSRPPYNTFVNLIKNIQPAIVSLLLSRDQREQQASSSAIMSLQHGDIVYLEIEGEIQPYDFGQRISHTTFSGFLLHANK